MNSKNTLIFALVSLLTGCSTHVIKTTSTTPAMETKTLADYQRDAGKFNAVISLPILEMTTNDLAASVKRAIDTGNQALDQIGKLTSAQVTFDNTVRALDDATYQASLTENRLEIIRQASTDAALRDAADDQKKAMDDWSVGLDYRQDVFRAIKAYDSTHPHLTGEDAKLLTEIMRDYRRAGLDLPKDQQDEVEKLRKKLSTLQTDFEANINNAELKLKFSK